MFAFFARRQSRQRWRALVSPRLQAQLLRGTSPWPRRLSLACLMIAAVLLVLALARLQDRSAPSTETTNGRNLLIVIDLSRSMLTDDVKPSRLDQAKALIFELLEKLPSDRIGVVGFAGAAHRFAPLTVDHNAVREVVEELDCQSITSGGSDLHAAIELGLETLKQTAQKSNGMLILTDGEEHNEELMQSCDHFIQSHTLPIVVGLGTDAGAQIPDPSQPDGLFRDRNGETVVSRMQSASLQEFAKVAQGRFVRAQSASDIPSLIQQAISDLSTYEQQGRQTTVANERFQWFVFPSFIFLMLSMIIGAQWQNTTKAVSGLAFWLVLIMGLSSKAQAGLLPNAPLKQAQLALEQGRNEQAQQDFEQLAGRENISDQERSALHLGAATAAYRRQDFRAAQRLFSLALSSPETAVRHAAHCGLANTLFHLGWQSLSAGKTYPATAQPNQDFDAMVKERMQAWFGPEGLLDENHDGTSELKNILLKWSDAARHAHSATELMPQDQDADHNRQLIIDHIEKLRDALKTQQQAMQMQMQNMGQGSGEEQSEGQNGDKDAEGKNGKNGKPGKNGEQGDDKANKQNQKKGKNGTEKEKADANNTYGKDQRPGETPQERALRKLNENADLQRGVQSSGRLEFRRSAKDW